MALDIAALTLLAFPQSWHADTGRLRLRFLCMPSVPPLDALAADVSSFADAHLAFDACVISSLAAAPVGADVTARLAMDLQRPPLHKRALFDELPNQVQIDDAAAPVDAPAPRIRKAVTSSYRALRGRSELGPHLVEDDAFECALHEAQHSQPAAPVEIEPKLRWGQLLALALRQPLLAEALGLVGEAEVVVPEGLLAKGGWLYVALAAGSDGAGAPGIEKSYAARIPPLLESRALYAAVLFPVDQADLVLDEIERDAERYDHGHARLVHGATTEAGASSASEGDSIRLGWDDEQVAEWFNRQVSAEVSAPMGTAGFRIDVREAGGDGAWHSLQRLRSKAELALGAIAIGAFDGEGIVEVMPAGLSPSRPGEYWMPRYFALWRGRSLVAADSDLVALHRREHLAVEEAWRPLCLGRQQIYEPVDDQEVRLLYGNDYEFRVRLADLSGGGPGTGSPLPPSSNPPAKDECWTSIVPFRRRRPPGPLAVVHRPTRAAPWITVARPALAHPEILYTSAARRFGELQAAFDADRAANKDPMLALPDPDVAQVEIEVEVRALAGEALPWQKLYTTRRNFGRAKERRFGITLVDTATLAGFATNVRSAGAIPLPTAREVRLRLRAIGRNDLSYFADTRSMIGADVLLELHLFAAAEANWLAAAPELRSIFLRMPPADGSVPQPVPRLAQELGLPCQALTLGCPAGTRTVVGCAASLRHTLSPEAASVSFASQADVCQQWILVLRATLARDWTWRGLAPAGIAVHRRLHAADGTPGDPQQVGTITLPRAISPRALVGLGADDPRSPQRQSSELLFFDALDPKPEPGVFPAELHVSYELEPVFEGGQEPAPAQTPVMRLPVATPSAQVPRLVSAGFAWSAFDPADDYSATRARRRQLWLQFAEAPTDPGDAYFVRVLAAAPDPLLTDEEIPEDLPEPPLPIDPEWVRVIDPGQSADESGSRAMQQLPSRAGAGPAYALVPLPEGVEESDPALFGMYTCEFRVGHADGRWCLANARWGPPLRVAGVQHPAPSLACQPARAAGGVRIRAQYATPTHCGRHVRAQSLRTALWALLYARVRRADGRAWQNLLLLRSLLSPPVAEHGALAMLRRPQPPVLVGEGGFGDDLIEKALELAGLDPDHALSAMVVEVHEDGFVADPRLHVQPQPLGVELGHGRLLRISELVAVPSAC